MEFDLELEEILASLKKENGEKATGESAESAPEPAPPQNEPEQREEPAPLAPPKPLAREEKQTPAAAPNREKKENVKKEKPVKVKKEKPKKEKPVRTKTEKAKPSKAAKDKRNVRINTAVPLPMLITLIALVAGIVVFGGFMLSRNMRIKSLERQCQTSFPAGIAVEYCEAYAKDRGFAGYLTFGGSDRQLLVSSDKKTAQALLQKGSDMLLDQQFRSVAVSKEDFDLEKQYGTAEAYAASDQRITFDTLFGKETYRVIAAYYTNTKPEDDNGYAFPYSVYGTMTVDSLKEYNNRLQSRRLYDTGFRVKEEDKVLTISTESNLMPAFRFVVVTVQVRGKMQHSDYAVVNEKVHYPQVYFDKIHADNIYFLAGKWYPEILTEDGTKQLTAADFDY